MKKFNKYTVIGMLLGVLIISINFIVLIKISKKDTEKDSYKDSDRRDFPYTYEYTSYDTSDEFKQIAEVENKIIIKDITNISDFEEYNKFNKCIVINNENELENNMEDLNFNLENDISISKEEWKNNTLVVLPYYNKSFITDLKVTDIEYNEGNVNIKISSSEGASSDNSHLSLYADKETNKPIKYKPDSNAKLLYIMINKIGEDKIVNYEIKKYDAKEIKESKTRKVYEKFDIKEVVE